jgi:hypothetical protein
VAGWGGAIIILHLPVRVEEMVPESAQEWRMDNIDGSCLLAIDGQVSTLQPKMIVVARCFSVSFSM